MDLTTESPAFPILTAGLDRALRVVSVATPESLTLLDLRPCVRRSGGSRPQGLYGDGLRRHACVEVCFVVAGACRLWTEEGFVPMQAGDIRVIPPGALHGEGWATRATPYRMLWLAQIGDVGQVFANAYTPAKGWKIEESISARNAGGELVGQAVAELMAGAAASTTGAHYLLQGGLLTMLARVRRHTASADPAEERRDVNARIAQVRRYLDLHFAETVTVASVAALFRLSPNYLNGLFSRQTGMGVHAYLLQRRLAAAADLLRRGDLLVKEVASRVGFTDPLYFSRLYRRHFKRPPSVRPCEKTRGSGV
jgi:AraC-like DNA-binding protein